MNRYQIAVRKANPSPPRGEVWFVARDNEAYVRRCILFCVRNRLALNARNLPQGALDRAVIGVSRSTGAPVVTDSTEAAMALASAYSHRHVYSASGAPAKPVIFYGKKAPPEGLNTVVVVKR